MKKLLNHIFIDGLSGMALGLFSTLIVGTIIQQIGNLIGGNIGDMLFIMGKMAAAMTGAGIGVGVAHRYQESPLVVLSAATAGMTGGFASKILAGSLLVAAVKIVFNAALNISVEGIIVKCCRSHVSVRVEYIDRFRVLVGNAIIMIAYDQRKPGQLCGEPVGVKL